MAEYIDRSRLIDNLHDEEEMGVSDMWEAIDNAIDRTPVADVRKMVHAKWESMGVLRGNPEIGAATCPVCGNITLWFDKDDQTPRVCCWCGTLMDEEVTDDA